MTVRCFRVFRARCYSTAVSGAHRTTAEVWFKLADPQTRNTFLQWAEKQHLPEIFVPVRRLFRSLSCSESAYSNL